MYKLILNFENYSINELGQIINNKTNKSICQWIDNVGYYQCILYKDGKRNYKRVHKLVYESFYGEVPKGMQVNHIDGNKKNNKINNLELLTNRENTQHGYDNNLYHSHHRCIQVEVYDMQGNYINTYKSIRETANILNINRKTLSRILFDNKANNYQYIFKVVEEQTNNKTCIDYPVREYILGETPNLEVQSV